MRSTAKTMMALAIVALAIVGIVTFTDSADADAAPVVIDEMAMTIDTEQGIMTLSADSLITSADIQTITKDLSKASYAISLEGMDTDLTIITLQYYELVKPYFNGAYFVITLAQIDEIGTAKWNDLLYALDQLDVDTTKVTTTITVGTPAAIIDADAEVLADTIAVMEQEKEDAVATVTEEKDAIIASMFTQEQVDEAIAQATAGLYTQEQVDAAIQAAIADLSDYIYTQDDLDAAVAKAIAGTLGGLMTAEQYDACQKAIADEVAYLKKEVARMEITEEEAAKILAQFTKDTYVAAISAKAVADKDAIIAELQEELDKAKQTEKPLWEQGVGQCLIIIVIFLACLVVWILYRQGTFAKVFKSKKTAGGKTE